MIGLSSSLKSLSLFELNKLKSIRKFDFFGCSFSATFLFRYLRLDLDAPSCFFRFKFLSVFSVFSSSVRSFKTLPPDSESSDSVRSVSESLLSVLLACLLAFAWLDRLWSESTLDTVSLTAFERAFVWSFRSAFSSALSRPRTSLTTSSMSVECDVSSSVEIKREGRKPCLKASLVKRLSRS